MVAAVLLICVGLLILAVGLRYSKLLPWVVSALVAMTAPSLFIFDNLLAPALGVHVSSTGGVAYIILPAAVLAACVAGVLTAFVVNRLFLRKRAESQ